MTALVAGAPTGSLQSWAQVQWDHARKEVRRLQVRIAKAVQAGRWGKVNALQHLLTHSFHARLLAVKRVTSNRGRRTPGTDRILWTTDRQRWEAACSLNSRDYRAVPLRRIYIPKKNGAKRPLSIPTMFDRAMQALYKLALAPVAETRADPNSYGFREGRSCADAIQATWLDLGRRNSAPWVLEGDIKGCFDNISHQWLLDNIPLNKKMLKAWLQAGYVEGGLAFPTRKGTPQGGIISPTLANMTLDGLEARLHQGTPWRSRVNFVRYADDFVVTAKSRTILERYVRPLIEDFLKVRGLQLSAEKTLITHIKDGFTFLGQTFHKRGRSVRITPSKEAVQSLLRKVGTLIRKHVSLPAPALIGNLNRVLRGWANYHRHVVSSLCFRRIDRAVFFKLWRMLRRRHPNKSTGWLVREYWSAAGHNQGFAVRARNDKGDLKIYQVQRMTGISIQRHVKIRAKANPYLPEYSAYFWRRRHERQRKQMSVETQDKLRVATRAGG